MAHTVDVALEFLVGNDGKPMGKVFIMTALHAELASILRLTAMFNKTLQHFLLHLHTLCGIAFQIFLSWQEQLSCYACQTHYFKNRFIMQK